MKGCAVEAPEDALVVEDVLVGLPRIVRVEVDKFVAAIDVLVGPPL